MMTLELADIAIFTKFSISSNKPISTKKPKVVVIKNMANIKMTNITRKVAVENKVGRPSFFESEK